MSRRNVNRDALQRQAERINRAPDGQADAARSAARANRARQRGCTFPSRRGIRPVGRADRESTRHLLSRQRFANLAKRSQSASDVRGRSGTRIRARVCRACGQWMRVWQRTLIGGSIAAGKAKEAADRSLFCTRQAVDYFLDTPGGRRDSRRDSRPDVPGWMPPAGDRRLEAAGWTFPVNDENQRTCGTHPQPSRLTAANHTANAPAAANHAGLLCQANAQRSCIRTAGIAQREAGGQGQQECRHDSRET